MPHSTWLAHIRPPFFGLLLGHWILTALAHLCWTCGLLTSPDSVLATLWVASQAMAALMRLSILGVHLKLALCQVCSRSFAGCQTATSVAQGSRPACLRNSTTFALESPLLAGSCRISASWQRPFAGPSTFVYSAACWDFCDHGSGLAVVGDVKGPGHMRRGPLSSLLVLVPLQVRRCYHGEGPSADDGCLGLGVSLVGFGYGSSLSCGCHFVSGRLLQA